MFDGTGRIIGTAILAIDPGTTYSGWCLLEDSEPVEWGWDDNEEIIKRLVNSTAGGSWFGGIFVHLVIEDVSHYGMPVGKDVFDTVRWAGRFHQAVAIPRLGIDVTYIKRPDVKLHLCGSPRANDSTIRQAIIDRYGGDEIAIGGKKCTTCKGKGWVGRGRPTCSDCCHTKMLNHLTCRISGGTCSHVQKGSGYQSPPGVLHGVSGHVWSALAVGLTYDDKLLINRV